MRRKIWWNTGLLHSTLFFMYAMYDKQKLSWQLMFGPEYIWSWLCEVIINVNNYLHLCWLKPKSKFNVKIPFLDSHGMTTPLLFIQTTHQKMKILTSGCSTCTCLIFIYLIELASCILSAYLTHIFILLHPRSGLVIKLFRSITTHISMCDNFLPWADILPGR